MLISTKEGIKWKNKSPKTPCAAASANTTKPSRKSLNCKPNLNAPNAERGNICAKFITKPRRLRAAPLPALVFAASKLTKAAQLNMENSMLNLGQREHEILKLIKADYNFTEIAKRLNLSPRSIGFLVAEIKAKAENSGIKLTELIDGVG